MFAFYKNITLVSYIPEKNKNVLLLSILHYDEIDKNSKLSWVDAVDKLCAAYGWVENSRQWPMVIFYALLNIAGINSIIIYYSNNNENHLLRREF